MKFTFEADLARKGLIDYNTAIQRPYLTKTRFELAKPYSVIVLAHSDGWFYGEGILAYSLGDEIRILDVYNAAVEEDVIDVRSLLGEEAPCWPHHIHGIEKLLSDELYIRMLDYREGILLFAIDNLDSRSGYLVAINIQKEVPVQERLLTLRTCSCECEARTDGRYVIVFEDPKRKGKLKLYDLEDEQQGIQERYLPDYMIYGKVVRQIYDGWFYLLTKDHFYPSDDIKADRAGIGGYYYCYRFPLEQARPVTSYCAGGTEPLPAQLQVVRINRQQPRTRENSNPDIPSPWSSLKLWRDEYSGQLVIVEGWHHSGKEDDDERAQYSFQPLQFPEPISAIDTTMSDQALFFFGSAVQNLDPADLPHAEKDCECPRDPGYRLKARAYVPRVSTFFDVYYGSSESPDSGKGFEFRLAVASCNHTSPSESDSDQLDKKFSMKTDGLSPDDNNRKQFVGVRRFPPNGAPKNLLDLLWPTTSKMTTNIFSTTDPRSILYQTKRLHRKWTDTAEQTVLINFDPSIRFPGLETMVLRPPSTMLTPGEYSLELARANPCQWRRDIPEPEEKVKAREAKWEALKEMHKDDEAEEVPEPTSPWFED